jgi:hypothetical protein
LAEQILFRGGVLNRSDGVLGQRAALRLTGMLGCFKGRPRDGKGVPGRLRSAGVSAREFSMSVNACGC